MIFIAGDWEDGDRTAFDDAEQHLINTEKHHKIYGTSDIINSAKVLDTMPFLSYNQKLELLLKLLSYCDTIYMLKGWECNPDVKLLQDYAIVRNCRTVYSKKF